MSFDPVFKSLQPEHIHKILAFPANTNASYLLWLYVMHGKCLFDLLQVLGTSKGNGSISNLQTISKLNAAPVITALAKPTITRDLIYQFNEWNKWNILY